MARGPGFNIKQETQKPIEIVDLYHMFCHLLDIIPAENDGVWDRIKGLLRNSAHSVSISNLVLIFTSTVLLWTFHWGKFKNLLTLRLSLIYRALCYWNINRLSIWQAWLSYAKMKHSKTTKFKYIDNWLSRRVLTITIFIHCENSIIITCFSEHQKRHNLPFNNS
jgi:hypothetical protein